MAEWRWWQAAEGASAEHNMAVDTALLSEVRDGEEARPIVRVYGWDRPAVSIGRNQDEAAARQAFPGLPLVRRPTGGRAVVHGEDLTVSLAARLDDLAASGEGGVLASYRLIAGGVIEALCDAGVPSEFGQGRGRPRPGAEDCFETAARCDIVSRVTGQKIVGCAQRREQQALLQQMSIPLVNIPEQATFLAALRLRLAGRLGVSAWIDASA